MFLDEDMTRIEISFSNTLEITERSDIGRSLLKSHLAPDLNIGITFESFNDSGKHPCSINRLKNIDRGKETSESIFKKKRICHQVQR